MFVISIYIIEVKDIDTHCLPVFYLNVFVFPWLKSAHIVYWGQ